MRHSVLIVMVGLTIAVLAGCESSPFCTAKFVPGIVVEVRDGRTGRPAAQGVTGIAFAPGYVDSLRLFGILGPDDDDEISLSGAYERSGRYTVLLVKEGYQPWICPRVIVSENGCHVVTEHLRADLMPITDPGLAVMP